MLRIESYVTPIILSYVDKYIKNLKPEDSQVSLWGGDAVFHNLDLRLDVLEEELSLPFSFVNGHIHELRIHVPWTKLTSEPIIITINTIECILKLRGTTSGESETSSQTESNSSRTQDVHKKLKRQDIEAPTSYVQSLINKIINNISIVCNNVILKYVEDDIVLSINVKTLEFKSVDENWETTFSDLTPENLILRNLITLTDLTVCLDKRNASGRIESYQEPLLYRCSFSCRVVRQFESAYTIQSNIVRYDVYCPELHFSLSDIQLPMFFRLLQLTYALYYGHLGSNATSSGHPDEPAEFVDDSEQGKEKEVESASWSSWAWTFGSSLLPLYWEEEEEEMQSPHRLKLKRILHMGFYVDIATWVFKITESSQDSTYYGPSKTKFSPFLKLEQQGSFMTVVVKGMEVVNMQMGISSFSIDPIGSCICGIADAEESLELAKENIASFKHPYCQSGRESKGYLSMSLFDDEILVTSREFWNYNYIWENHLVSVTESSLLEKTAAFAMDYIYMMDIPPASELTSEQLSEINANTEYCNLDERAVCRAILGPIEYHVSSGFYHRFSAVQIALQQYDYSPYYTPPADKPVSKPDVVSEDEIQFLLTSCPMRKYSLSVLPVSFYFYSAQHPNVDIKLILNGRNRKRQERASAELCMARILAVPAVVLKCSKLDMEYCTVMYPQRVVSCASFLRPPPLALLHNCHSHFTVKFHNIMFGIQNEEGWLVSLIQGFSPTIYCKYLLLPHIWSSLHQPKKEYIFEADHLIVYASMPQVLLLKSIISSWFEDFPLPEQLFMNSLVNDAIRLTERYFLLVLKLNHFEMKLCDTQSLVAGMASLDSFSLSISKYNNGILSLLALGPETVPNQDSASIPTLPNGKLANVSLQLPKDFSSENVPAVFTCKILRTSFLFDPILLYWLKYFPKQTDKSLFTSSMAFKKISDVRPSKITRKSSEYEGTASKNESSSMSHSETWTKSNLNIFSRQSTILEEKPRNWKEKFVSLYPLIKNLLIYINIETVTLFLPTVSLSVISESDLMNAVLRTYLTRSEKVNIGDTTVISFPYLVLQNTAQKQVLSNFVNDVPIILPIEAWSSEKEKLPWSLNLINFQVYSLQGSGPNLKLPVLKNVDTTATLALTTKYEGPILSQIGVVIHLDMTPLDFCGCRRQVEAHINITESILHMIALLLDKMKNGVLSSETLCTKKETKDTTVIDGIHVKQSSSILNVHKMPIKTQQSLEQRNKLKTGESTQEGLLPCDTSQILLPAADTVETEESGTKKQAQVLLDDKDSVNNTIIVTTWMQWTVARVSASLFTQYGPEQRKLTAEFEDLTLSLDIHHIYSKLKCKVTNISLLHYIKSPSGWKAGEYEGVILTGGDQISEDLKIINPQTGSCDSKQKPPCENTNFEQLKSHGFLSFTCTKALCQNVHTKWNQMVRRHLNDDRFIKETSSPSYLSEVDLRIQPFDVICFPSALKVFTSVYEPWLLFQFPKQLIKTSQEKRDIPFGLTINNKTLPLVYLQAEGIRFFFPSPSSLTEDLNCHNIFLVQLGSLLISPQVDNPLSRIIIRPDVYLAAEQARVLGVPGAEVEDRQYQIDFLAISASTGSWQDLTALKRGRPRGLSSEMLGVRGENPALEWNNYDPSKAANEPEAIFHPVLTKMDVKLIAAPAVVYQDSLDIFKYEDCVLVAGYSIEINATSDINIYISLAQIMLVKCIADEIMDIFTELRKVVSAKPQSNSSLEVLDSGVDCDISSMDLGKIASTAQDKGSQVLPNLSFVPIEVLITGSKITLIMFEKCMIEGHKLSLKNWQRNKLEERAKSREKKLALEVASTESEPSPLKSSSNFFSTLSSAVYSPSEVEDGYEGSEEESVYEQIGACELQPRLLPLFYLSLSQPHTFFKLQTSQQRVDVSCFDFILKSVPKGFSIKGNDANKLPCAEDFASSWIETKPGDLHPKTGIPPALLTLSAFDFLHKLARMHIEIGRPVRVTFGKNKWDQIHHVYTRLSKLFPVTEAVENVSVLNRIKTEENLRSDYYLLEKLRSDIAFFEQICLNTNQIAVNFETSKTGRSKTELHCSISGLSSSITMGRKKFVHENLEPAISDITLKADIKDFQVKTLYHSLGLRSLLKPWTLSGEIKLFWLAWCTHPTIEIRIISEIFEVNIGPENLLCLIEIENHAKSFMMNYFPKSSSSTENVSNSVSEEKYPNLFFQDDLRAGVFQYLNSVESYKKDIFPQPYQVVFDKCSGFMVWCYPEPRALMRVDIYPVPFVAASDINSAINDPILDEVTCVLQFYDALRGEFITYQKFQLSESQFCQLDLPGMHEKQLVAVSTIWRVWIDYEEDENDFFRGRISVSPEALAACMRVDSLFSTDLIPSAQAVVVFKKSDATLVNHMKLTGSKFPPYLSSYESDQFVPEEQTFLTASFNNISLRASKWASTQHIEISGSVCVLVLNYKFLTYNTLAEVPNFKCSFTSQVADAIDKPDFLDAQVKIKSVVIHLNQSTVKTLVLSKKCWHQAFQIANGLDKFRLCKLRESFNAVLITNYILCNNSSQSMRVGQVNTDENIFLQSSSLVFYCWRSHKVSPKLQICVSSSKWKWSEPIDIDSEGQQICSFDTEHSHKFLLICKKLSPCQMQVTIEGLVTIANCLHYDLELRFIEKNTKDDSSRHAPHYSLSKQSKSLSYIGDPSGFKLRYRVTWSTEVPLSTEKDTVLLKIPFAKVCSNFITIFCKIWKQKISGVYRVLVLLTPQFLVKSHLPRPLTLHLSTLNTKSIQKIIVKGRAQLQPLPCENSVSHQLTFQLNPDLEVSHPPIMLTPSMVEQISQSSSHDTFDMNSILDTLFEATERKWPFIDPIYMEGDFLFADQPKIDLQVGFSSLFPNCNSVVLDIRPWSLIVNHTGIEILLKEGENMENIWYIPSGAVFAPPKIDNFFTFGILDEEEQFFCIPLQLLREERWYTMKFEGQIPLEGETNVLLMSKKRIFAVTILSRYQDRIQILHLLPTYSIANNSEYPFEVSLLCIYGNDWEKSANAKLELTSKIKGKDLKETALLSWEKCNTDPQSPKDNFHIQIFRYNFASHPISFKDINTDGKINFTMPRQKAENGFTNEAFLLTVHPVNNRVKFVLQKDPSPQMLIYNNTTELLYFGQGSLNSNELMEEEMNVFPVVSSVSPSKAVYYTFPYTCKKFPEISTVSSKCPRLHISHPDVLKNDNSEEEVTLWSQGIDIQHRYDQFIAIPGFGDARIHTERIGHLIHVFIDSASRIEISAKDIRSRINTKPTKTRVATSNTPSKMAKSDDMESSSNVDLEIVNKEKDLKSAPEKRFSVFYGSFLCSQLVFVLKDDLTSHEYISEVMRVTVEDFIVTLRPRIDVSEKLRALSYKIRDQLDLTIFVGDAQIDNQVYSNGNYDFPVILAVQKKNVPSRSKSSFEPLERIIQSSYNNALCSLSIQIEYSDQIACINTLQLRLKPVELCIEDSVIYFYMEFMKSFFSNASNSGSWISKDDDDYEKAPIVFKLPFDIFCKSQAMVHPIRINKLTVDDLSILLSLHASIKLYVALDKTPLQFQNYQRHDVVTTSYSLGHNVVMHYLSSALFRAGWVVSSLDLLGNPGGFARMVGSGIRDFIQLPYEGILQGPWAFVAGITHGSLSLMKHLTAGTLVSVTNLANSVARNMERLSMDEDHVVRNESNRRLRPSSLSHGITQGLSSFGISILGAIGGIFHQPMQAMMSDGLSPTSIVGGLGKGLVGVVAKPIGGAADFVVHTGQGLLQGTGWKQERERLCENVKEPYSSVLNSPLKITWKLLAALPMECRQVVSSAEATLIAASGAMAPVTVLLTPQVIFILGVEEDAQQHAFPLDELTWKIHSSDPTILYLEKTPPPLKIVNEDAEPISGCPERVADYVRSTCSEGIEGCADISTSDEDSSQNDPSKDNLSRAKLCLSEQCRNFLVSAINISIRAAKGQGFLS